MTGTTPQTTLDLVRERDALGVESAIYRAEAEAAGRCPAHPAYEPENCPSCGTARTIGGGR